MAVMVFIFDNKKNLLLLKRIDNDQWEPVKGGIDIGEDWTKAGLRELKEETGMDPAKAPELFSVVDDELDTSQGTKTKIKGYVTYCFIDEEKPALSLDNNKDKEHMNYKWVPFGEIEKENIYPPLANSLVVEIKKVMSLM